MNHLTPYEHELIHAGITVCPNFPEFLSYYRTMAPTETYKQSQQSASKLWKYVKDRSTYFVIIDRAPDTLRIANPPLEDSYLCMVIILLEVLLINLLYFYCPHAKIYITEYP